MSSATLTLIGMYNWDNTLFDNMQLPDGIDKATLIDSILMRSGEFEVLYSDFDFMKYSIGAWSRKWYPTLERWVDALSIRYNPLENYDRQEEWTDKRDIKGKESGKSSGEDSGSESRGQTSNETGSDGRTEGGTEGITEGRNESGSEGITGNRNESGTESGTEGRTENSTNGASTTGTSGSTTTTNVSAYDGGGIYTPKEQLIVSASDGSTSSGAVSLAVSGLSSKTTSLTVSDLTNKLTSLTVSGASNKLTSLIVSAMHENTISINISGLHANKRSDEFSRDHTTDDDLEHKGRIHGNIGVTTSQQMLLSELDLGYWNIYEKVTDIFLTEFVIPVY